MSLPETQRPHKGPGPIRERREWRQQGWGSRPGPVVTFIQDIFLETNLQIPHSVGGN